MSGGCAEEMGEGGKGNGSISPSQSRGRMRSNVRSAKGSKRNIASAISVPYLDPFPNPWHTARQTLRIPDSLSSHLPPSHLPNISRPTQAGSLFQTLRRSTRLSVPRDLISGRIFMKGISIRRATQRSPHLLSLISSPKPSSTPRRG